MSQMSEWLFWPTAKQMQTESLSLCLKKRNELSQWRESPQQSLECFKVHYIHGKRSCLDMKLTLAAGKLSTSAGVVQYKEHVVCSDLTPPTQTASETNSPAALRTVASKTCQVDSKQLLQLFQQSWKIQQRFAPTSIACGLPPLQAVNVELVLMSSCSACCLKTQSF